MRKLQTFVEFKKSEHPLRFESPCLFMGSCFSQHMANNISKAGYTVISDPFGISFNPISIAENIAFILSGVKIKEDELFEHQGIWSHFRSHSSNSHFEKRIALSQINDTLNDTREVLNDLRHIYITFGTAWVFKREGMVVNNCHKLPADQFQRELVDREEIVNVWCQVITVMRELNPDVKFCFTLSPVRHWKDGAEGNSLSKSLLRVAIHEIVQANKHVSYFPSYEFMMDECRDYRFYADDLLHPSSLAIEMIWEKFRATQTAEKDTELIDAHLALTLRKEHRPRFSGSAEDLLFQKTTLEMEVKLKAQRKVR
jgi:hypothetical protein